MNSNYKFWLPLIPLAALAFFLGCRPGSNPNTPVGPYQAETLSISMPAAYFNPALLGASSNEIYYEVTGPGMQPVTGVVGPFGAPVSSGSFNFNIPVVLGSVRLLAFQLNDASNHQPLALGAVELDLTSQTAAPVTVEMGSLVRDCYNINAALYNAGSYFTFETDALVNAATVSSPAGYDVEFSPLFVLPLGASQPTFVGFQIYAFNSDAVAYMGNGNLVQFAAAPSTGYASSSGAAKAGAPVTMFQPGDVYCVKLGNGGHAWVQVINAGSANSGPSFRFRVNTSVPFYAYEQTTVDLSGNCPQPLATYTPTVTTTSTATNSPTMTSTAFPSSTPTLTSTITATGTPTNTATVTATMTPGAALSANWTEAIGTAAFAGRTGQTSVAYAASGAASLWVIGGENNNTGYLNDVWSSPDGATWTQVPATTPFTARYGHTSLVYASSSYASGVTQMWVMGGYGSSGPIGDIWASPDGATWTQLLGGPGFPAIYDHSAVVFNGNMWVLGGLNGATSSTANNDTYSGFGGTWELEDDGVSSFTARYNHTSLVYSASGPSTLWVIGGFNSSGNALNDVWYSTGGITWLPAPATAPFTARGDHASFVYDNYMWVVGGFNGATYLNDAWYSSDGATWTQATETTPFTPGREAASYTLFNSEMWVIGGYDGSYLNDVWHSP